MELSPEDAYAVLESEVGNAEDTKDVIASELADTKATLTKVKRQRRSKSFTKPEPVFVKPEMKGTLQEKVNATKAARAKFEAEHAAWEAERKAFAERSQDAEMQHSVAVANAQAKVDFWTEMARVADGGAEVTSEAPATSEAPVTGRGKTQFNVHEDLPGSEKNSNFEDNNKSRKDENTESGEAHSRRSKEMAGRAFRDENAEKKGNGEIVNKQSNTPELIEVESKISSFPEEYEDCGILGRLKTAKNGLAIYVDEVGTPVFILSDYSNKTYCHLYRDSQGRWSSEMMNTELDKSQFVYFMSRAMGALPEGARFFEGTSISVDGLRVYASQLKHGFTKSKRTFECDINAGDKGGIFEEAAKRITKSNPFPVVFWEPENVEELRDILEPHLEALGVPRNAVRVRRFKHNGVWTGIACVQLPELEKSGAKEASNSEVKKNRVRTAPEVSTTKLAESQAEKSASYADDPFFADETKRSDKKGPVDDFFADERKRRNSSKRGGDTKLREVQNESNPRIADAAEAYDSRPETDIQTGTEKEAEQLAEKRAIAEAAKAKWENRTGVKVNLYERVEDVTDPDARAQLEQGVKVAGWFNAATGEVGVFVPNIRGERDVERTIIHEVVGHLGIKGLLGEKGHAAFLDSVWGMMSGKERDRYLNYPGVAEKLGPNGEVTPEARRAAADEFVARVAELTDIEGARSMWRRIVTALRQALRNLGIKLKMSEVELEDVIRKAEEALNIEYLTESWRVCKNNLD